MEKDELTRSGTCTSNFIRLECDLESSSTLDHVQKRGLSYLTGSICTTADVVGDDFNIPRNEPEVSVLLVFGFLESCVSEESSSMSGELDELTFVVIGAVSGADLTLAEFSSDRDGAESIEAGIWTVRDRSFPFEAILGVLMERESVSPVWASIRCRESSGRED